MNKTKLLMMLSLFAILMTVFGSVYAQDSSLPAFKISSAVTDEKVVLMTKNFPADTAYTVSMADPADPDHFTAVAKFNSKTGGSLSVTVKIPEKFHGLYTIDLMVRDASGAKILGSFVNDPAAAPVEEPVAEEPAPAEEPAEEPVAEEPAPAEEPAEEPAAEEPAPAEEPAEEPVAEEPAPAEEPAEEPAAEEPAAEEPAEDTITLANRKPAEEPVEEPVAEEPAPVEEPVEEPVAEEPAPAEEPVEEPAAEEPAPAEEPVEEVEASGVPAPVCDYSLIPTVTIDAVTQNKSVTFTTANFPANSSFTVSMGVYVASWTPAPRHIPGPRHAPAPRHGSKPQAPAGTVTTPVEPPTPSSDLPTFYVISGPSESGRPVPGFVDHSKTGHAGQGSNPHGTVTTSFSGVEVGTFNTGDGSPQTLTFEIPQSLAYVNPIALWISDLGPCGFYSYNYFYNATTNW